MNKKDLVDAIAERTGAFKKDVDTIISAFTEVVGEALANGNEVSISGFGKFERRKRVARQGRNLNTGEMISIPETIIPAFKPGSKLKEIVKG